MSRKDWAFLLVPLLSAIAAFVFLQVTNVAEFQKACRESGGTAVWNGQYYQCIYRKGGGGNG